MSDLKLKRAPSWEISDSDPEDQPGTGTAEPEDEPGTDTTEPEDEPGSDYAELEYQQGTGTAKPEYQQGTDYIEHEYQQGTDYTEHEYQHGTDYTEHGYQQGTDYTEHEYQQGTGTAKPEYQQGTDYTEHEYQQGTDYTELEYQEGTDYTEHGYQQGTGTAKPEYQQGTDYTEHEYQQGTYYREHEYQQGTYYREHEYQQGTDYTEHEYQPGFSEPQDQPSTSTTKLKDWSSTAWDQEIQSTPWTPWTLSTPRWEEPAPAPAPAPAPVPAPGGMRRWAVGGRERLKEEQKMRKEEAERIKKLKPEEYLKTVTINIHPALLQDPGSEVLLSTLTFLEWRNRIEEHDLTHSISWSRTHPDGDGRVLEEDQILMVVTQMDFMDIMISVRQALIGQSEEAESLFHPLSAYLNRKTGVIVSLLVTGGQLCREVSSEAGDDEDEVCPRSQFGLQHTDIEEVLVYLQLYKNVTVHFLLDWQEVTNHMCTVTNALSKRPIKSLRETSDLGFCVTGSWAAGVRVDRSGRGLSRVWTRQIHQLHRVSAAMAAAVTTAYPSPRLLMKAYKKVVTEDKQRFLLADLTARGGTKERRLGPQLSNRVHRMMTSQNPGLILDEGFVRK
ncbi:putative crossover junction endonuclease EME2 [Clarias magur]|uniref:Putative crossover junction endonuclease EME2 n=1 Tax=Clarias magur TaxID=1594786 RepID=A0A8J4WPI3_CLAMG|nr:putative crossover junction endonuclease EME2 [Clarias magur]